MIDERTLEQIRSADIIDFVQLRGLKKYRYNLFTHTVYHTIFSTVNTFLSKFHK